MCLWLFIMATNLILFSDLLYGAIKKWIETEITIKEAIGFFLVICWSIANILMAFVCAFSGGLYEI